MVRKNWGTWISVRICLNVVGGGENHPSYITFDRCLWACMSVTGKLNPEVSHDNFLTSRFFYIHFWVCVLCIWRATCLFLNKGVQLWSYGNQDNRRTGKYGLFNLLQFSLLSEVTLTKALSRSCCWRSCLRKTLLVWNCYRNWVLVL